jgi:hypothetical protein
MRASDSGEVWRRRQRAGLTRALGASGRCRWRVLAPERPISKFGQCRWKPAEYGLSGVRPDSAKSLNCMEFWSSSQLLVGGNRHQNRQAGGNPQSKRVDAPWKPSWFHRQSGSAWSTATLSGTHLSTQTAMAAETWPAGVQHRIQVMRPGSARRVSGYDQSRRNPRHGGRHR